MTDRIPQSGNPVGVAGHYDQYDDELDPEQLPKHLRARQHKTREEELDELFPVTETSEAPEEPEAA